MADLGVSLTGISGGPAPSLSPFKALGDITAKAAGATSADASSVSAVGALQLDGQFYKPDPTAWYTAKPYGFRFTSRKDGRSTTMFLPISPSNLNITTSFAVNVIPTLYGTVEEHSDVRYYDIVIEGTTGMAPKFTDPGFSGNGDASNANDATYAALLQSGRSKFPIASGAPLGGFFSSTIGQITNILNQATKIADTIFNTPPQTTTGIYTDQTGYIAFHNLYRFLLNYKKDAAGVTSSTPRTTHPLVFFNYKDGNQYNVAVKNFILRRSNENPMLYYYQITMRGYNIHQVGGVISSDDLTQRLTDLGLNGVQPSSLLSNIKSVSSSAKAIVGSAVNGVNLFGR
jgi:hypothetical protein